MPNKPVNNSEIDNAIKNGLLNNSAEAKVSWEEIEQMLPKKSAAAKAPFADYSFSMNSFAGVIIAGSTSSFQKVTLFVKKWSMAVYATAGSIIVATAAFLIFYSTPDSLIKPAVETVSPTSAAPIPTLPVNTKNIESLQQANINNNTKDQPVNTTEPMPISSTEPATTPPPVKLPKEKISSTGIVQLKTDKDTSQYDFSENVENKMDSTHVDNEAAEGGGRKSKVLYYKESLSLDRLEKRMSANPQPARIGPEEKEKSPSGLFKNLFDHPSAKDSAAQPAPITPAPTE
ncbi:MAG: hypothetical protein IT235_04330 [Bacteroidia bacterium]|nr:hypothetical protein [Bacteroidia bacterium]